MLNPNALRGFLYTDEEEVRRLVVVASDENATRAQERSAVERLLGDMDWERVKMIDVPFVEGVAAFLMPLGEVA